jgi:hypothetical protein
MITFKHSGCLGDIVCSLPTVKALASGQPVRYLIRPNRPGNHVIGPHPAGNFLLTEELARSMLPLLQAQPYITEAGLYAGETVDVDLDLFRETGFDYRRGSIFRYYCHAFPVAPDLSSPWLTVEPDDTFRDYVIVNRTQRYHNRRINYRFLSNRSDVVFVGLPQEYAEFNSEAKGLPDFTAQDMVQLAQWLAGAKAFVGNQSCGMAIAEALKTTPRLLEVCPDCPNVVLTGPDAYEAICQPIFEQAFAKLVG